MSEWITDRRPTRLDSDEFGNFVLTCNKHSVFGKHYASITDGQPWMPYPKPYVEPKRERRRGFLFDGREGCDTDVPAIETFPDDPDFDELLDAIDEPITEISLGAVWNWKNKVKAARKPRSEK